MTFLRNCLSKAIINAFNSSKPRLREMSSVSNIRYLGQDEAIKLDEELFNEYKYSVDQLMELAGLSVATVVHKLYFQSNKDRHILCIAGPGNNGGDALVAARHLKIFNFQNVSILVTKKPSKELYKNLVHQAEQCDVNVEYDFNRFLNDEPPSLIVDGLFGFSFKPPVRPDYEPIMKLLKTPNVPVISIDIPSGWDVETGPGSTSDDVFMPETLVSLTAPKKSANFFKGKYHFLGGRFVPAKLAKKYSLSLPEYPSSECIVEL